MVFLILVLVLIAFSIVMSVLVEWVMYVNNYQQDMPHIDFKTFHSWYLLNPSQYQLGKKYAYRIVKGLRHPIGFTNYIEYVKYRYFVECKRIEVNENRANDSLVHILDAVQSDIDVIRAEQEKALVSAEEEISRIKEQVTRVEKKETATH